MTKSFAVISGKKTPTTEQWVKEKDEKRKKASRLISRLAFLKRLTQDERIAILSSTLPLVKDFVWLLADEADLDANYFAKGVKDLQKAGLLTKERAAEVLA
jgi:hypothetical protein